MGSSPPRRAIFEAKYMLLAIRSLGLFCYMDNICCKSVDSYS
ncbi:hypothetical protein GY50_0838 [Dehalococcoides mccartyi GY50]|nr:hypothetical protein GY50_0838 [Dehalococcoides mccartyi GY50]